MPTRRRPGLTFAAVICLAAAPPGQGQAQQRRAPARDEPAPGRPALGKEATWSLAAVGDAIVTRRLAQFDQAGDPRFQQMAKLIRDADAAFVNLEGNLFRLKEFRGWAEVENGASWLLGPPQGAADLQALGFDLFNRANNHTTDWGVAGMRATDSLLDELRIAHSGTGMNLGQASRPAYFDTPKGRLALIGLATSFTPMSRAGAARGEVMGRPGLNALRVDRRYEADSATFSALRRAAEQMGASPPPPATPGAPVRVFGATVTPGVRTRVVETVNPADEGRILGEIRNAAKLADFVIVNSHSHEPSNDALIPPQWLVEFVHKCLDAGATTYVVHGPHQLRGIEIYRGRPIFYSLGNFVFQNETTDPIPADGYEQLGLGDTALAGDHADARFRLGTIGFPSSPVWYESVIALPTFKGTRLVELKLYPIDLGQKAPRSQRGTPRLADDSAGRRIIERLARLSAPFGTTIVFEKGVGVWRPNEADAGK
ncbi:MAG TPA: CapA family protein [Gemmatimonadales bacterium]|jgi:poly-gamma-glutamate synthesis protein (capsule biosynthesis protein)|nr:CapA family protein [Gemmatimonadales bacterium]